MDSKEEIKLKLLLDKHNKANNNSLTLIAYNKASRKALFDAVDEYTLSLRKELEDLKRQISKASESKHGASGLCCSLREQVLKELEEAKAKIAELENIKYKNSDGSFNADISKK